MKMRSVFIPRVLFPYYFLLLVVIPSIFSSPLNLPAISNDTNSSSSLAASPKVQIPIPGTNLNLRFTYYGPLIPSALFAIAFSDATTVIIDNVAKYPGSTIPANRFDYDSEMTGIHLSVIGNRGNKNFNWLELFQIMQGLRAFVLAGHSQLLQWEIMMDLDVVAGVGLLWYYPPKRTERI